MAQSLEEQANLLLKSAELTGNIEHLSIGIAAKDSKLAELLSRRLSDGLMFRGTLVTRTGDKSTVTFSFEAKNDVIYLFSPSLRVHIDLVQKRVVGIEDLFIEDMKSQPRETRPLPFALATPSNSANAVAAGPRLEAFNSREQGYIASVMPQLNMNSWPDFAYTTTKTESYCGTRTNNRGGDTILDDVGYDVSDDVG